MKSRVIIQSKLTVVSSKPTGSGEIHKLSRLDQAMGLHSLHVIFYYLVNPFKEGLFDLDLGNLRASLAELLSMYPPVTGRLARGEDGNWEVKCNDAGVRMVRATVGSTLDEWLRSADASEERDLTAWEDMPDDPSIWSPFQIQLNDFEGGGLAIGLSCSHMHADPTSATLFFKSWTEFHQGEPLRYPPLFRLPELDPHRSPDTNTDTNSTIYHKPKFQVAKTPSSVKMATATFKFSNSKIKQCLSKIQDKCPDATPFDFLAAIFWTRIAQLKGLPRHDHTNSISICIDFRKIMHEPIPYEYFGNALHFSLLSTNAEELDKGGLGHVTGMVHRHTAGIKKQEFVSIIDYGQNPPAFQMYGPELTCVSMENMIVPRAEEEGDSRESLMYAATFKKGETPVHVSYHVGNVEGEGLILVMPSPEKGLGRMVTVTLPDEQIGKLCEDQVILDLNPTVLLSGSS